MKDTRELHYILELEKKGELEYVAEFRDKEVN